MQAIRRDFDMSLRSYCLRVSIEFMKAKQCTYKAKKF